MRRSWTYIDGIAYEKGVDELPDVHQIIGEIQPYKSMITGEMITSRSQHREHLKKHGCREVGNEVGAQFTHYDRVKKQVSEQQRNSARELIRAQVDAMRFKDFRAAIKKDADRVKWNSRDG